MVLRWAHDTRFAVVFIGHLPDGAGLFQFDVRPAARYAFGRVAGPVVYQQHSDPSKVIETALGQMRPDVHQLRGLFRRRLAANSESPLIECPTRRDRINRQGAKTACPWRAGLSEVSQSSGSFRPGQVVFQICTLLNMAVGHSI